MTHWDDIAWTYSGVPGHHAISPSFLEEQEIDTLLAVVGLLQTSSRPEQAIPIVMLWVDEAQVFQGDQEDNDWKLWSVITVPTE